MLRAHAIFSLMRSRISVRFSGLAKHFDMRLVFRDVSGEARPGEVLLITGPNGSGKSTLLALLAGLSRPSRGTVLHLASSRPDGSEIPRSDWRNHIGVVSPAMAVYDELSGLENLRFFARVRGLPDIETRCRAALEQVGLDPTRGTLVRGFSTGMTQRLKIAQAMLHEPPLMLLDEPGSNLDPEGRQWLERWVQDLLATGRTLILATNDPREMEWGSCRVALPG